MERSRRPLRFGLDVHFPDLRVVVHQRQFDRGDALVDRLRIEVGFERDVRGDEQFLGAEVDGPEVDQVGDVVRVDGVNEYFD